MTSWTDAVGPMYTVEGTARVLGVAEAAVRELASDDELLLCRTADGVDLAPAWQFDLTRREVYPGVAELLHVMTQDIVGRWTVASWSMLPLEEVDRVTFAQAVWSRDDELVERALRAARHDAARWRQ